jgi:hypothetical protein
LTTLAAYELAKAQGYGMVKTVLSARTVAGQAVDLVVAAPLAATEMQERLAGHVHQT